MSEQPLPDRTVDTPSADAALEAGLAAAFGPDSGPPLPAGASVLRALGAVMSDVPRVQLRDPESGTSSPIVRPRSEEMPASDPTGRYQLHGEIARGGMGAILKGRDVDLGRDIAVKVLLETHQGKTELLQRFVEEAQINGQLQHPGIVPVYALGQFPDKRPYFTMKLVKGQTLAKLLEERKPVGQAASLSETPAGRHPAPQDLAQFLKVFDQVCQTLAYAHARGVIHRDLKPSNVMVGAFGEVQVMDWGLAKVLAEGGIADEAKTRVRQEVSVIRTRRSDGSEGSSIPGSQTQAGSVLGTPAYMAPEQARGDVELVDERADVFGLGAILCEILSGQPPFTGKSAEAQRKAQTAKLDEAHLRLDNCRADKELVELAKRCLTAEPWDRPRNASAVAAALTAYQQSVAERLRQAELDRAAAEARAAEEKNTRQMAEARAREERKRRRATLALAAALLALVVAGGGAAAWWWQQRTALVRDVEAALAEAETHQQAGRWPELRAALGKAEGRLGGGSGPEELRAKVQLARLGADMVAELDEIRLKQSDITEGHLDFYGAEPRYVAAFAKYGIAVPKSPPTEAARQVRESAIREVLLAGLDDWLGIKEQIRLPLGFDWADPDLTIRSIVPGGAVAEDGRLKVGDQITGVGQGPEGPLVDVRGKGRDDVNTLTRGPLGSVVRLQVVPVGATESRVYALTRGGQIGAWLVEVLRAADDDAWRQAFREAVAARDGERMKALAQQAEALAQSPSVLRWLGNALKTVGLEQERLALLRQAQQRYPGDFWLNYELGACLGWPVRPAQADEAVGFFRAAVAIRPVAVAHYTLGATLANKGDPDGAIAAYRQSITLDPNYAQAYEGLERALRAKGNVDLAIAEFRNIITLAPKSMLAQRYLGFTLATKGHWQEGATVFARAIELDPQDPELWLHRAGFLLMAGNTADYRAFCNRLREDLAQKPDQSLERRLTYLVARTCLLAPDGIDPATGVRLAKEALADRPRFAWYLHTVALAHYRAGQFEQAARRLQESIEVAPDWAGRVDDWLLLTMAHQRLGRAAEAAKLLEKAIQAAPKEGFFQGPVHPHDLLAFVLLRREVDAFMKSAEPASAHNYLGWLIEGKRDPDGAIAEFRKAIAADQKFAPAHRSMGTALRRKNDLDGAIAAYREAVALDPKYSAAHFDLGLALLARRDLDGAIAAYRQVLLLEPKSAPAHVNLGGALRQKGELDGAIAAFRQAIKLDPKFAGAHTNLGTALRDNGDVDGAIAACREAIALDPKSAPAHTNLGAALYFKGDFYGAVAAHREAIAVAPRYATAHNNLAWVLANCAAPRRRDPHQAVASAETAVELAPGDANNWNTLGAAHYRDGNWKEAAVALEKSMAMTKGGNSFDWFFLAMARRQLGAKDEARKWYEKAVVWMEKNQPNNDELRRFRAEAAALLELPVLMSLEAFLLRWD